jgi:transposase
VKEAHLAKIIKVDLQLDLFSYNIDEQALRQAELLDGKLLLVTNVTALSPQAIVQRYKSLADIERGFRVLKSEIELAPRLRQFEGQVVDFYGAHVKTLHYRLV